MTESSSEKLVEALRKAVSRTSMLAEGSDPELDSVVRQIRQRISKTDNPVEIQQALSQAEPLILKSDSARLSRAKQVRDTLHDLMDLLEQQPNPVPMSAKRKLESRIRSQWEMPCHWPDMFKSYLELAETTLNTPAPAQDSKTPFLQKLFNRTERPKSTISDIDVTLEIGNMFANLMKNLSLPAQYDQDIEQLQYSFSANKELERLPKLLNEAVSLIMIALGDSQKGLTNYLNQLNKQLASINQSIVSSYKKQRTLSKSRENFDLQLREQVSNTSQDVKNANDLESLKELIDQRMNAITETMVKYRSQMDSQEKQANQSIALLKNKVNFMEKDADALRTMLQEQLTQATTDSLTQLPNRAAYQEHIQLLLQNMKNSGSPLCIAVCDIDYFKSVNDSFGHLAGDKVLRLVPRQIRNVLSKSDLMFRYGGEEFIIIFPDTSLQQAAQKSEMVRREVEKTPFNMEGEPVSVSISIGVAEAKPNEAADDLFARADKQLYSAKEAGRNKVMIDQ